MLEKSLASAPQLGFFDIFDQVDRNDPLLQLGNAISWKASDEVVVRQWKRNPYYQFFCGEPSFQSQEPCHSTERVKFRNRLGKQGIETVFAMPVALHGDAVQEERVLVDTRAQEKAVTYSTNFLNNFFRLFLSAILVFLDLKTVFCTF